LDLEVEMKKMLLLTSVLLALTATVALAGGVNFNWGTVCYTEAPVSAITFACDTNAGVWHMVSSFIVDSEVTDMVGFELTMVAQSADPVLPDWWQLGSPPDCRTGKASFLVDFSTAPQTNCFDWEGGSGVAAYIPSSYVWTGSRVFILTGAAIGPDFPFDLLPGTEYYAGDLRITNSKVVGTGPCAGCAAGVSWAAQLITAAGLGGTRLDLTTPISGGNQCLSWNGGSGLSCGEVPVRNTTWGQVKSLYR
jgi:hypothetical protein